MRGDHHRLRFHFGRLLLDGDAPGAQLGEHGFVVDQVAEDGERSRFGLRGRQRDGVPDAEAHAQMFCTDDSHVLFKEPLTLYHKVKDVGGSYSFKSFSGDYLIFFACCRICSSRLM